MRRELGEEKRVGGREKREGRGKGVLLFCLSSPFSLLSLP
jgi:hypothetical protein